MAKSLVIVESPTKARTLKKYLGEGFDIKASAGHIMDLPKRELGVDVDAGFVPKYEIIKGKGKIIKDLKKAAMDKDDVYLAPDPDREGEAIAWHIARGIKGGGARIHRALLYEITSKSVREAIENSTSLDENKFNAQQARRVLDRLVGYKLSPFLWKKVRGGLSAGRVQSVSVRLICEREREIKDFVSIEFWSLSAHLKGEDPLSFYSRLSEIDGKKVRHGKGEADITLKKENIDKIIEELSDREFRVKDIVKKEKKRNPYPPFITSSLQREAAMKLRFSAKKTMIIAQQLYEGIEIGSHGPVGLISYMRTDSTRVASEAINESREYIINKYGDKYLPPSPNIYKSKKGAQDAHEAIRPTSFRFSPEEVGSYLKKDQLAIYDLIWRRFLASQMKPAVYDQTSVEIDAGVYLFRAIGSIMKFEGFMTLYTEDLDEEQTEKEESIRLPELKKGEPLNLLDLDPKQHFTQPPPRYSESSLIKELEVRGIGRPSTYALIMSNILSRDYVIRENSKFIPTELGILINDILVENFPDIMSIKFTAGMEEHLDRIEEGKVKWTEVLKNFYEIFDKRLQEAIKVVKRVKVEDEPTDESCEKCGSKMVIKSGRYGRFYACPTFPKCKNTRPYKSPEEPPLGINCPTPNCKGEIVPRRSKKKGTAFFGCSKYPVCKFILLHRPIPEECPSCSAPFLVEKNTREGKIIACHREECQYQRMEEV